MKRSALWRTTEVREGTLWGKEGSNSPWCIPGFLSSLVFADIRVLEAAEGRWKGDLRLMPVWLETLKAQLWPHYFSSLCSCGLPCSAGSFQVADGGTGANTFGTQFLIAENKRHKINKAPFRGASTWQRSYIVLPNTSLKWDSTATHPFIQ